MNYAEWCKKQEKVNPMWFAVKDEKRRALYKRDNKEEEGVEDNPFINFFNNIINKQS